MKRIGHLKESTPTPADTRPWDAWLRSPAGRYLLRWEQGQLDAAVADVFGFHALQCGLPRLDCLRANRMPNRMAACTAEDAWILDDSAQGVTGRSGGAGPAGADPSGTDPSGTDPSGADPSGADPAGADPVQPIALAPVDRRQRLLLPQFEDLPFASGSLDLVVLPHVLEFASDPHQVVREAERVLRPEGRLIVTGFNPVSLWGARQLLGRGPLSPLLPADGQMLGIPRLRDWLKLMSFEVDRGRYGCYAPPFRSDRWFERFAWIEKAGDRWWPICGAVYLLSAVKRVRGMRLIGPAWKRAPQAVGASAAAVRRSRPRTQALSGNAGWSGPPPPP